MDKSLKDRVLESTDIVEVVGEHVALRRKGKDFVGLCPFHADHTPSMAVSPTKQIFKCWACGAGGDVIKFVQLRQRVDFREALSLLAKRAGLEFRRDSPADTLAGNQRDELRRVLTWARSHFQRNLRETPVGQEAIAYARRRGLTDVTIDRFQLGLAPESWDDLLNAGRRAGIDPTHLESAGLLARNEEKQRVYDRFRNRLMFPIADAQGRTIAFGGRTLGDDAAKYLNSPESALFSKSRVLYAMHLARQSIESSRQVIVVEGYLDAVMLHQAGIENVVATLGTALTDTHAKALAAVADRVSMCFDSDDAGVRAADRAVETALRHKLDVRVVQIPDAKDPADFVIGMGADAFKSLLQSAIGALEFKWQRTLSGASDGSPRARRDAAEKLLSFVAAVTDNGAIDTIEQGLLIGRLAELLSLPAGSVYELLAKSRARDRRIASPGATEPVDASAYDASLSGVPKGIVAAVEELFGLTLADASVFPRAQGVLAQASESCEAWLCVFSAMEQAWENHGGFDRRAIMAACDDVRSIELISRASARATENAGERCEAAARRLHDELSAWQAAGLRQQLRGGGAVEQRDDAFAALLTTCRSQHRVLAAEDVAT